MKLKKLFNKKDLENRKIISLNNDIIPREEIEKNKNITFVVCTADEKTLKKILNSIVEVKKEYKDKDFTVIISSSYEKLHKLSNGAL